MNNPKKSWKNEEMSKAMRRKITSFPYVFEMVGFIINIP